MTVRRSVMTQVCLRPAVTAAAVKAGVGVSVEVEVGVGVGVFSGSSVQVATVGAVPRPRAVPVCAAGESDEEHPASPSNASGRSHFTESERRIFMPPPYRKRIHLIL
jgi:hypothetical protein